MNFDLIVIGSGPGGYKAAITAAHLGAKVALVEKGLAGGTCLNQGCIPKSTLLHLATLIEDINDLQGRGLVGEVKGDFSAAMAHKNAVVKGIRDNFSVWLKRLGIQVFYGTAKLSGAQNVDVLLAENANLSADEQVDELVKLTAPRIVLATGSKPKEFDICPTDGSRIISSKDFMFTLDHLPVSVLFVGGGAIGTELGFLMHQFGSKVCIVEQGERLLNQARIPDRASNILERKFKRIGIEVRKNASVASCEVMDDSVSVTFTNGDTASYERVLVAIGREPVITGLGLEDVGIALTDDGFIQTSDYLETSVPGIYAIGDVKPGPMTANAALHDAKIAAANAIKGNRLHSNYFKVPVVINSALEIAAVGLTEDQADEAGFESDVARASFGGSGKSRAHHDFEGFIEVVHDTETGQLLGGCIVGPEAGEQIHMLEAACQSNRGLWFFKDMSYSHPSWCEELETAIDPYTAAYSKTDKMIFPGIYADKP
ncbi:dihydrolipoyl dehydrogenase family protein [Sulfurirhabdus autotrophica]|uniref:Dihydrolipoyl dehydrogenase n=1 Tax=Sulfurirhabdus autotrophica TaxID=1706046 RepID=A0A4R3Y3A7_9PROT|nr:NAD(P)/FAD-dependent oxidoreductase [Sulfurirhabdus autotrophica]TCV86675.1 dihydrolipoamide dehydrogenase [Sulfurirhabdus autotrophica]